MLGIAVNDEILYLILINAYLLYDLISFCIFNCSLCYESSLLVSFQFTQRISCLLEYFVDVLSSKLYTSFCLWRIWLSNKSLAVVKSVIHFVAFYFCCLRSSRKFLNTRRSPEIGALNFKDLEKSWRSLRSPEKRCPFKNLEKFWICKVLVFC